MTGQIASPNIFSLELVLFLIAVAVIVGAVDLIRQPWWAWRRAGESKISYLVLVVFLPLVGLGMYLFGARPKVAEIASAGRAASLPFERFDDSNALTSLDDGPPALPTFAGPASRSPESPESSGAVAATETELPEAVAAMERVLVGGGGGGGGFFRAGGSTTRTDAPQVGMATGVATGYRPTQRTSLPEADSPAPKETAPAGWKADPTGRHQLRYWDGSHWTEHVADARQQARDPVA
jgi:hypothetical protein